MNATMLACLATGRSSGPPAHGLLRRAKPFTARSVVHGACAQAGHGRQGQGEVMLQLVFPAEAASETLHAHSLGYPVHDSSGCAGELRRLLLHRPDTEIETVLEACPGQDLAVRTMGTLPS